jgi:aryl-alcohol dehydrogenase-like predicted oxidoreductase
VKYRRISQSELVVSEVSLGSWLTFGVGVDVKRSSDCIRSAVDNGINFFDTANCYGDGAAEETLGHSLLHLPRDKYIIATKLFFPVGGGRGGLSREQVHTQLEASLRRLRTDYIDLYICHRFDETVPLIETFTALTDVVRQGKVRYIGFSEWSLDQVHAARVLPDVSHILVGQMQYSLLYRSPEKTHFQEFSRDSISVLATSTIAQGMLSGKYRAGSPLPRDSRAASYLMSGYMPRHWRTPDMLKAVQEFSDFSAKVGISPYQLAIAWTLRHPCVASAIVGATSPSQILENSAASTVDLPLDIFLCVERIFSRATASY